MKNNPPYLGAAYYPEDWPAAEQDRDIEMMKKAGINSVRIAEFAWYKMEPKQGQYEFGWLHDIVNKLSANGIAVVMCTPTATPPQWLSKRYPDVFIELENGRTSVHGGRRHCCSNNTHYREYSAKIVEKLGEEFGNDPNVIGWQIDNELYCRDFASGSKMGCFCIDCVGKFHEYLREKYKTIENLNERWDLNIFSQCYDSFEDVPVPRDGWHNPHLKLEWITFQHLSHVDFSNMQSDILHKYTSAPVGTDAVPLNGMDCRRLNEKLDIMQLNHYDSHKTMHNTIMWLSYARSFKDRPFWVTETEASWVAHVTTDDFIKPDGFCKVNTFLAYALGGEMSMYWPWRTHWGGHELVHGAVLDSSGRPQHIFDEVREAASLMEKSADFLRETKVDSAAAFHFSPLNWNMFMAQPIIDGVQGSRVNQFFKPCLDIGLCPDVIDACTDIEKYKLIFTPMALTLEEYGLQERICSWVENGGTWVVGPFTDTRDNAGAKYIDRPFGIIEKLTCAQWLYGMPVRDGEITAEWSDGREFHGNTWYDVFNDADENIIARIRSGHRALNGKACVVHRKVGKGHVIILGTFPGYDELMEIYSIACGYADIKTWTVSGNVLAVPRKGDDRDGLILTEYSGTGSAVYALPCEMTDVVTGRKHSGEVELSPYEILVLEK